MKDRAIVFLIPTWLDEDAIDAIPAYIIDAVKEAEVFFVENERSARRFLKKLWKEIDIGGYPWFVIHKAEDDVKQDFLQQIKGGKKIAILSEAGCPGIADPGQMLVAAAQEAGVRVKPLVGPSSILLALMDSFFKNCGGQTRLCIAVNLTGKSESIQTRTMEEWRKRVPEINKQPAIFILQA